MSVTGSEHSPMRSANFFAIPFVLDATIAAHMILVNLLAQDLGADAFELGMMGSLWGVFYGVSCYLVGRASHRVPRRAVMTTGIWIFCLSVVSAQLARQPWHLYFTAMINGAGCALFWPLFETLLHDNDDDTHARRMTLFNLGWTTGLAAGSASGGMLKALGAKLASAGFAPWQAWTPHGFGAAEQGSHFGLACVAMCVVGLGLYMPWVTRRGLPALAHHNDEAEGAVAVREDNPRFLYMGWVANFFIWSAASAVYSLFPKLARELNGTGEMAFPDRAIGFVLAIIVLSQAIASRCVCRGGWWQYRVWPSCVMQALAALGLVLVACGASYGVFACAMILLGMGRAMTYVASMHYGLADPARRGHNMGVHETLIGAAVATGPLLGGAVARLVSLRAAFVGAACWIAVALVVQVAGHASARR